MTNKVKPFFIRITDDMTPQMVQDAFDKCVDAGATFHSSKMRKIEGKNYPYRYSHCNCGVFGVDCENLVSIKESEHYFTKAKEITLDQLDEWLGLDEEWNGEGLPPVGAECEILFKEYPQKGFGLFIVLAYHGGAIWVQYVGPLENNGKCYTAECSTLEFRKPETPEQKAEREKKEEAEEMIQCLLDNYTECEDSAIDYVIDYLKECETLGK